MRLSKFTHRLAKLNPILVLLIACLFSYGLLIPWLGFYWDDWPAIWFRHFLGSNGLISVFSSDRPLLGYLFSGTMTVIGESPFAWQLFGLAARSMSVLVFWWFLRLLWPNRSVETIWAALLFAVYPGFQQQFISVTYSHVFLLMAAFLVSLAAMVKALQRKNLQLNWYLLSWSTATITLFSVEYFFGLELLRPVLIYLVIARRGQQLRTNLKRSLLYWLPYLGSLSAFLYWRLFLHITPRGEVQLISKLIASPGSTISQLLAEVLADMFEVGIWAWIKPFNLLRLVDFGLLSNLLFLIVVIVAAFLVFGYLQGFEYFQAVSEEPALERRRWSWLAIGIGLLALFVAGWPFWITNLPIELRFPWDRFTLPMILGSSLLMTGCLTFLMRWRWWGNLIMSLLIAFGIGSHFEQANLYRREWATQQDFFRQLTWRAPGITPGTVLLTSELPFVHYSDNSLTAPLNWTYYPQGIGEEMPLLIYALESRLGTDLPSLNPRVSFDEPYRVTYFYGTTSQALVYYFQPPGCVYFLDPKLHQQLPQKPKYLSEAMPLSNLAWIESNPTFPAQVPSAILSSTDLKDWCYYFEAADLSRQEKDWSTITQLGDEAFQLDQRLYEINAPEFLPYIEAYVRTGDWERAEQLTTQAYKLSNRMSPALCSTWQRVAAETEPSPNKERALQSVVDTLSCEPD